MNRIGKEDALNILRSLHAGIDPGSRRIIREVGPLDEPMVRDALAVAIEELEAACGEKRIPAPSTKKKPVSRIPSSARKGKLNAGRKWTEEDDRQLYALCRKGLSLRQICGILQRRERGVRNRLSILHIALYPEFDPVPREEGLSTDE